MKYRHVKTGRIFSKHKIEDFYESNDSFFIPSEIVENSNEWKVYNEIDEEIKRLQNIPCLSINDVGKVFVTANRENPNNEMGLERQGRELIKLVQEKLNK
jgi:hypothetical protein